MIDATDLDCFFDEYSHRRYNPLKDSWILVCPHRAKRPWQGAQEPPNLDSRPEYDPECYLCPGNKRNNGDENPLYKKAYIFQNDFSAISKLPDFFIEKELSSEFIYNNDRLPENDPRRLLIRAEAIYGKCYVICFSPRHDLSLARLDISTISIVIEKWKDIYKEAMEDKDISYCLIFENKGSAMGCSNPHPHGQVWMTSNIPDEAQVEHRTFLNYFKKTGRSMLEDYYYLETNNKTITSSRSVYENASFIAFVPYWATWPFEVLLFSKRFVARITELSAKESIDLADALKAITIRYDNLFECSFPYSMGIHQAPTNSTIDDDIKCLDISKDEYIMQYGNSGKLYEHLHFHFYPPLLRSASVKKFQVGFELLGMPQRDITPEKAAKDLCAVDCRTHYIDRLRQENKV